MKFRFLIVLQKCLLMAGLLGLAGQAQAQQKDAKIMGRIRMVSKHDNALIVKLQAKAIHNTNPNEVLMLTSNSLWLRYDTSLVSYNITPLPASDSTMTDGDFYYPNFQSPYYGTYGFNKYSEYQHKGPNDIAPGDYAITHVVWEGWLSNGYNFGGPNPHITPNTDADVVNEWKDVAFLRFPIKKSGVVQLRWGVGYFENEIYDENMLIYQIDDNDFEGLDEQVTFIEPVLQLTSSGLGVDVDQGVTGDEDPYVVSIKSTDANIWDAGTLGFHIYYNSEEATFKSYEELLNKAGSFGWGPGVLEDQSISDITNGAVDLVQKGPFVYDRRITYLNHDRNQGNDKWPANSDTGIEVLGVVFEYLQTNVHTFLETVDNEDTFMNYNETLAYTSVVTNRTRVLSLAPASTDPLPVTLTSFTASLQATNTVALAWGTASEDNNDKFIIERSANGKDFQEIGSVKGKGYSRNFNVYKFTDNKALSGVSYYRLKQMDFDGGFEYSKIVSVANINGQEAFAIKAAFPNPFQDLTTVDFTLPAAEKITLTLTDLVGKVVKSEPMEGKTGLNTATIRNLSQLPNGVYFIKLSNTTQQISYKLLKQ